jgi:hypothetical protein
LLQLALTFWQGDSMLIMLIYLDVWYLDQMLVWREWQEMVA